MTNKQWNHDGDMMELTQDQRIGLEVALGLLIADWSETHYAAGWYNGIENTLPFEVKETVTNPELRETWGFAPANALWTIAKLLGYWVNYEGEPHMPKGFTFN